MGTKKRSANLHPEPVPRIGSAPTIERSPLATVELLGSTHIISYVNPAFCRLLGKNRSQLLGNSFASIVPGGDKCAAILDSVYEMGEAAPTGPREELGSSPSSLLYAMWPSRNAAKPPVGVIIQLPKSANFRHNPTAISGALLISGLHQHELTEMAEESNAQSQKEIRERKLAEAALQAAKERLTGEAEHLERMVAERTEKLRETVGELEAFSYSVAHDMRAPLRSMRSFSQILLSQYAAVLDARGVDYLERIERSSTRLDCLIQNVLDYTKILRGAVPEELVDLDRLLRDILDTYPDWHPPAADITIKGTLPKVLGNDAFLTQCISNLLSNAVKFVLPGAVPHVRISAEPNAEGVRLCIQDSGIGIAVDKHARIFGMFEKVHPAAEYEGTGIGLTIARKAAHRMGAEIGFHSEPGKGSTFWIELRKG